MVDSICENSYGTSCEIYATDEYDAHDNLVYKPPPLNEAARAIMTAMRVAGEEEGEGGKATRVAGELTAT